MELENNALSRRGLVALGGAVGGAALLGATGAITAQAAPAPGAGGGIAPHDANSPMSEPGGLPRIGSPLIGGYTYVYRNFYDFTPWENGARTFNGYGAYGSDGTLRTMFDAPPGAILRDMEWYFSATTTGSVYAGIWTTGAAYLNVLANASVAAGAAGLRALRTVVPSSSYGPYSPGTRLAAFAAGTSATFLINGVRLGFSMYPAGATMLATPTRVYDSRSGAKIGNGQTRIHSLASWIPAGATAAIVNVHITSGEKSGGLAVYNTGLPLPSGHSLYWSGLTVAHETHVKLPSDRKIKVTARGVTGFRTHYMIDVIGYIA